MSAGDSTIAARIPVEFRAELEQRVGELTRAGVHYPDGRPPDLSYLIRVGLRYYLDAAPNEKLRAEVSDALADAGWTRARPIQGDRTAQAKAARDRALAQVDANADPDWKIDALDALIVMAGRFDEFVIADVWDETGLRRPHEARAMGPVVRKAVARGIIENTGRAAPSNLSHRSVKPVWRSLIRANGYHPQQKGTP